MHDLRELGRFFAPQVDLALADLCARVPSLLEDNGDLRASLATGLQRDFFELTHRTLIAQFKLVEESISFDAYCHSISEDVGRDYLLSRYPVLRRLMDQQRWLWVAKVAEVLTRYERDREAIARQFFTAEERSPLAKIKFGMGDNHRGGKGVAMLHFENGARLMYKPRALDVDCHFAALLKRVSDATGIALRAPKILSGDGYGWVEWIAHESCTSEAEVELYYRRLGVLLAMLYAIEASDFHYENIIAHGPEPILIDLETLFHPQTPIDGTETNEGIDDSVLRTGLLPRRIALQNGRSADISGMTDVAGQEGVVERMTLQQDNDGNFRFERARGVLLGAQNVPMLDGVAVRIDARRIDCLKAGFNVAYRHIMADRDGFVAALACFVGAEVRVLFRNTLTYTHLLDEARHPALMLKEDNLARHFETLRKLSKDFALGDRLMDLEIPQLQRRDVPMFTCRVGETALIVDTDTEIADFFVTDGFRAVANKVARFDENDLSRQLWIIDKAFAFADAPARIAATAAQGTETETPAQRAALPLARRYLAQAVKIADYICDEVHQNEDHASWLVTKSTSEDNNSLALSNAFYDLYGGMPGEIAFLTQIARSTSSQRYQRVADKAYRFLSHRIAQSHYSIRPIGLFAGWGSILWLTTALGRWREDERYFAEGEGLLGKIDFRALIAVDRSFAMVKGSAGFLIALAEHIRATGSMRAIELVDQAFRHLQQHRYPGDALPSWRIASALPLSGLSHGCSGFAVAFARIYEVTGDPRYAAACHDTLASERALFLPAQGNWVDRRDHSLRTGAPACAMSWAHGAPGIGLARLAVLNAGIDSDLIREDLDIAMRTTLAADLADEPAAISGDFGTIELPLAYAELIDDRYREPTRQRLERMIEALERRTARLAEARTAPLGLMGGVTGVGYQCLRIGSSTPVASLIGLQLEPLRARIAERGASAKHLRCG